MQGNVEKQNKQNAYLQVVRMKPMLSESPTVTLASTCSLKVSSVSLRSVNLFPVTRCLVGEFHLKDGLSETRYFLCRQHTLSSNFFFV